MIDYFKSLGVIVVSAVIAIVLVLALMLIGVFGFGWFTDATANRQGTTQVKQQINGNGAYRIASYNQFYDECATVQTDEASITNVSSELATTTDEQRKLVLEASLTALLNKRANDINTYNADSAKTATAAQFKASDLPYRLNLTDQETSCTA